MAHCKFAYMYMCVVAQRWSDTVQTFMIAENLCQSRSVGVSACITRDTTHNWKTLQIKQATARDLEYADTNAALFTQKLQRKIRVQTLSRD